MSDSQTIDTLELIERMSARELVAALDALASQQANPTYYYLIPNFLFHREDQTPGLAG